MKALFPLIFLALALPLLANDSDETLKFYISKSELIVSGQIVSEPLCIVSEKGVPNYFCDFKVQEIAKGDASLKNQVIKVNIMRFEMGDEDTLPMLKKDGQCILFLKSSEPNNPSWVTTDFWFGVQNPSSSMIRSLVRIIQE